MYLYLWGLLVPISSVWCFILVLYLPIHKCALLKYIYKRQCPYNFGNGFLLAVEPSYSSVKQWLSARPVVCHHVPLYLETKYDNIKKALGYFWDIFPTWKQIWQNHKGIGMFLKYFSNLEINMIKSKGLWDILRQRRTTAWYKMPLATTWKQNMIKSIRL